MTRPHIEFIQSQVLPWEHGLYGGGWRDVEMKVLSKDDKSGESSLLIRYPPGWSRNEAEHLLAHEEFFVLDGALDIDGVRYTQHCYAHLPAGYLRAQASSREGAVVLAFFSANPKVVAGAPAAGLYDEALLVERLDTVEMPWDDRPFDRPLDPNLGARPSNKTLRHDPYNGEWTFLVAALPQIHPEGWSRKRDSHPVVEEMYLLTGELAGNTGIMQPGAYFWRPPHIPHGPYGSPVGWMGFFRSKGGDLINIWSDHEFAFSFSPPYKPILPPEYAALAQEEMPGRSCY